jgi:hypothetical protein
MQGSDNRSNSLDRRDAMKVAGVALAATALAPAGVALAHSPEGGAATSPVPDRRDAPIPASSMRLTHKRVTTNGVNLHYVTAGQGPVVLCMHGWPQNHREFLPVMERLVDRYSFIAPIFGDSGTGSLKKSRTLSFNSSVNSGHGTADFGSGEWRDADWRLAKPELWSGARDHRHTWVTLPKRTIRRWTKAHG